MYVVYLSINVSLTFVISLKNPKLSGKGIKFAIVIIFYSTENILTNVFFPDNLTYGIGFYSLTFAAALISYLGIDDGGTECSTMEAIII